MELETARKLIKKYMPGHADFVSHALKAENYYRNKTDIVFEPKKKSAEEVGGEVNILHNADNKIPLNFHGLLVNQKAAYMYTAPPVFDIGDETNNKALRKLLGDEYFKTCKDLCIDASNASIAWLHVWRNELGEIEYAPVPPAQIVPVWSRSLKKKLLAAMRTYQEIDETDGETYIIYEFWTDRECSAFRRRLADTEEMLMPYQMFMVDPATCELSETYKHDIGEVPFFPFHNNNIDTGDLDNIKPLIDTYCKVFSGFVNDLEDIQEIILILTNYGGQDLREFLHDLKYYKTIKTESMGEGDKSGVSTLTIDIPVEAREKLLKMTRASIFEQGQGIDPDPQNFGNSSGVALNFLYALLELKAGLQETEFRPSFARFIRCLCRLAGLEIKDDIILQTWTRTSVKNEQEKAQIASGSEGVISKRTIIANHPWVDSPEKEMQQIAEEEAEVEAKADVYKQAFKNGGNGGTDPDDDDVNE